MDHKENPAINLLKHNSKLCLRTAFSAVSGALAGAASACATIPFPFLPLVGLVAAAGALAAWKAGRQGKAKELSTMSAIIWGFTALVAGAHYMAGSDLATTPVIDVLKVSAMAGAAVGALINPVLYLRNRGRNDTTNIITGRKQLTSHPMP